MSTTQPIIAAALAALSDANIPATRLDDPCVVITLRGHAPFLRAFLRATGALIEYGEPELSLAELKVSR